jgi:hypothetical protein
MVYQTEVQAMSRENEPRSEEEIMKAILREFRSGQTGEASVQRTEDAGEGG